MTAAPVPPAKTPFVVALLLAMGAGYCILMFLPHNAPPEGVAPAGTWYESVRMAVITAMRVPTGLLLFACGYGLGWAQPRYWFLLAIATLAVLPIAAIAELVTSARPLTLWTLVEFIMFFCMALPAIGGAAIGRTKRYKGLQSPESAIF